MNSRVEQTHLRKQALLMKVTLERLELAQCLGEVRQSLSAPTLLNQLARFLFSRRSLPSAFGLLKSAPVASWLTARLAKIAHRPRLSQVLRGVAVGFLFWQAASIWRTWNIERRERDPLS